MPRTLDSGQIALIASSGLIVVRLVKMTTYADRDTKQGPTEFYFSNFPVEYDYGNTGTDRTFWDILPSVTTDVHEMVHTPNPSDLAPYTGGMRLNLNNFNVKGQRVYSLLSDENLLGADIEYAELAVPALDSYPVDLTSYTGDEHTVLFRGVVKSPGDVTDTAFSLLCVATPPSLADYWTHATADTVAPFDFGKRLPQVYGQAKRVPCITYDVGASTSTTQTIEVEYDDCDFTVLDASGFPDAGDFNAVFGDGEEMTCSKIGSITLHINASGRAQNGTTSIYLKAGVSVEEVAAVSTFVVAGHECSAIDALYMLSPYSGNMVLITSGFTKNLRDSTLVPGRVVCSVSFTQAQMESTVQSLKDEASQIGVQPQFSDVTFQLGDAVMTSIEIGSYANIMPYSIVGANDWSKVDGSFQAHSASADPGTYTSGQAFSARIASNADPTRIFRVGIRFQHNYTQHTNALDIVVTGKILGREVTWDCGQQSKTIHYDAGASTAGAVSVSSDLITLNPNDQDVVSDLVASAAQTAPLQNNYVQWVCQYDAPGDSADAVNSFDSSWGWAVVTILTGDSLEQETKIVSGGFEKHLFADVDGYEAPGDSLTPGGTVTVIDDMDSTAANWTSTNLTDSNESTIVFEGAGSLKLSSGASATFSTYRNVTTADFTDEGIRFRCYMEAAMHQALLDADTTSGFVLVVSSDTGATTNLKKFEIPLADIIPDRWVELVISVNDSELSETGTLVITSVDSVGFEFTQDAATAGRICYIDIIERAPSDRVYSVAHRALIEHPVDVMTHWIEEVGRGTIERASRATALTNLGSNVIRGDVRNAGTRWDEIAQRFAHSSRSNLVPDQTANGLEWRILTPSTAFEFTAPVKHLTAYRGFVDQGRDLDDLFTDSLHRYGFDPTLGNGEEAYKSVVTANPTLSDVATTAAQLETARKLIGSRQTSPAFFPFIDAELTAEDVAGYYVQEAIAHKRGVFKITELAWMDGFDLQLGDIVEITPPWKRFDDETLWDFDADASSWIAKAGCSAVADNAFVAYHGLGSMRLTSNGIGVSIRADTENLTRKAFNLKGRSISAWVFMLSSAFSPLVSVRIRLSSDVATPSNDFKSWFFLKADLTGSVWNNIKLDVDSTPDASGGTFDSEHVRSYRVEFLQDVATGPQQYYFDNMIVESERTPCRVISISKNHETLHSDLVLVEVVTV